MNRRNNPRRGRPEPRRSSPRMDSSAAAPKAERKAQVIFGPPYVVLEDESKKTFIYDSGAWVPNTLTIAEYRQTCQVRELPQKVNRMIRYEVRSPVES